MPSFLHRDFNFKLNFKVSEVTIHPRWHFAHHIFLLIVSEQDHLACSFQGHFRFGITFLTSFNVSINPSTDPSKFFKRLCLSNWCSRYGMSKLWIVCPIKIACGKQDMYWIKLWSPSAAVFDSTLRPLCLRSPSTFVIPDDKKSE